MPTTDVSSARQDLVSLIEQVNRDHRPILIEGEFSSAVLLSAGDWRAIEESLYLNAIPGMAESIAEGMRTPISELSNSVGW